MPPVSRTFPSLALLCLLLATIAASNNKNQPSRNKNPAPPPPPAPVRQPHTSFKYQATVTTNKSPIRPSNNSGRVTQNKPKTIETTQPKGEIPLCLLISERSDLLFLNDFYFLVD